MIYYHAGADQLNIGDTIRCCQYSNLIVLSALQGIADQEFCDHLEQLKEQGLTYHGYRYLLFSDFLVNNFVSVAIELYWEYIRWKNFPSHLSRLQAIFAWDNIKDAASFAKNRGVNGVVELECENGLRADMSLLSLGPTDIMNERANLYWKGETCNKNPVWEHLLQPPAKIISRYDLIKEHS